MPNYTLCRWREFAIIKIVLIDIDENFSDFARNSPKLRTKASSASKCCAENSQLLCVRLFLLYLIGFVADTVEKVYKRHQI